MYRGMRINIMVQHGIEIIVYNIPVQYIILSISKDNYVIYKIGSRIRYLNFLKHNGAEYDEKNTINIIFLSGIC